jgi:hypothetical protein
LVIVNMKLLILGHCMSMHEHHEYTGMLILLGTDICEFKRVGILSHILGKDHKYLQI